MSTSSVHDLLVSSSRRTRTLIVLQHGPRSKLRLHARVDECHRGRGQNDRVPLLGLRGCERNTTNEHHTRATRWAEGMGRTEDDLVALLPHFRNEGLAWVHDAGEAVDR